MLTDTTLKRLNTIGLLSKQGKQINGLFRLMENEVLWKQAYINIKGNDGAVTKGVDEITLDGFSYKRIQKIIQELKVNEYQFQPVRRTYIPKKNGKKRPLGIPNGNDKLVQEVVKIILEEIYEPIFSNNNHGFRKGRSCHTALTQVKRSWTGTKWLIEMDIKSFFDNLNHEVLIKILSKKIQDKRFLLLINKMLKAGYMENWNYQKTFSGTVQGGNISPILSNIYLNELDKYMEQYAEHFNKGKQREVNPEYSRIISKTARLRKKYKKIVGTDIENKEEILNELTKEIERNKQQGFKIPSGNPYDKNYRRIFYNRYADDFIIGVIGAKEDAIQIAKDIQLFLKENLQLDIAEDKFGIVHASKGVNYLGYIVKSYTGNKIMKTRANGTYTTKRTVVERMQLIIPKEKMQKFAKEKGYGNYCTFRSTSRPNILHGSDAEIISTYNAELRGLVNYYSIANNAKKSLSSIVGLGRCSCAKTLADKHKISTSKMIKSMKCSNGEWIRKIQTDKSTYSFRIYRLKTDFVQPKMTYKNVDIIPNSIRFTYSRTELISKLDAKECELCGSHEDVEVHHIRKMKDIKKGEESWKVMMRARNRKTIVLCSKCHHQLHSGTLPYYPK